jgi:hypothetical protein
LGLLDPGTMTDMIGLGILAGIAAIQFVKKRSQTATA